ncbi:GIY-YIG nuclease family protein [Enterobacter asburiae]|uniref:GIY-YIG nuclease family protein n=1 Tax=Enterobacter asburiae TaxID=61645 RepID=UPI003C13016C
MTVNEPEMRAAQISQGTGIPAPFEVHSAYFSDNPRGHEQEFHRYLSNCRINPGREFSNALKKTSLKQLMPSA